MALSLKYQKIANCIFIDKASGLNTHSPDWGKRGILEILEEELGHKLFVVHRLDKGTSGALLFATSSEQAQKISEQFEKHLVQKKYYFLTDKKTKLSEFTIESHIEKLKNTFVSHKDKANNARTDFKKLKSTPVGDLWQACPASGKPHQIRLHAQDAGISLLGDSEHGGTAFTRLCLHSSSLKLLLDGQEVEFKTTDPCWVQNEMSNLQELALQDALEHRQRLYNYSADDSLRLLHAEIDSYRIDQFADTWWVYWYKESDPSPEDLALFSKIAQQKNKKILIRKMLNRGDEPGQSPLWGIGETALRWQAQENNITYELRSDSGLSPGLFLDQRHNRAWVQKNAKGRSVLNLFSYTSGFSVNAALGGALEVVSVDVSSNFIEWSKRNFEINQLDPEKYEFWVSDALLFLKGCQRRKRKFDLIICDPPSFGRNKTGVFSISKNYEELIISCLLSMNKNALLMFSTNYEKWDLLQLQKNITRLKSQIPFQIVDSPLAGLDFELPDQEPLMKSVILRKS